MTGVENTIEVECALEVLSLFMHSLCGPTTWSRSRMMRVSNPETLLDTLAQKVVDAKLAISIRDALMYIVPAFARFDMLKSLVP